MANFEQYNVVPNLTPVRLVSIVNVAGTYSNGPSNNSVGSTLVIAASSLTVDSVLVNVADRILLVNQSSANQNGIYVVSSIGATVVLQRSADLQSQEQLHTGFYVSVGAGTVNAGAMYAIVEPLPAMFGTNDLNFNAMITSGLGTAATKAASDNTESTLASTAGSGFTSGNIVKADDTVGSIADGGLAANKVLTSAITTPDVSLDLVRFDVVADHAALATGGSVTLYASSAAKQYKVIQLWMNSGGTNFSGGSGDRLGQVTDGTTIYSVIPATDMQALVNAAWGDGTSAMPFPASAALNTSSAAGASLVFKYSGGGTDYSAGSVTISGILQRVA